MKSAVKTFVPKNRIEMLARKPGGVTREQALAQAAAAVESLREESIEGINAGIAAIEVLLHASESGELGKAEMSEILRLGDRIINLAGTFGLQQLATISMQLCDLLERFIETDSGKVDAISVFICALRMAAPSKLALNENETKIILAELKLILRHYGVGNAKKARAK